MSYSFLVAQQQNEHRYDVLFYLFVTTTLFQ